MCAFYSLLGSKYLYWAAKQETQRAAAVNALHEMGFKQSVCAYALRHCNGSTEQAAYWLMGNAGDL